MKQVIQQNNKLASMVDDTVQPASMLGQRGNLPGSIRERVTAVRKDAKQEQTCDAGFGN